MMWAVNLFPRFVIWYSWKPFGMEIFAFVFASSFLLNLQDFESQGILDVCVRAFIVYFWIFEPFGIDPDIQYEVRIQNFLFRCQPGCLNATN